VLLRPGADDFATVARLTGLVVYALGFAMLGFAALAFALEETNDAYGFLVGASLALLVGGASRILLPGPTRLDAMRGLASVASIWIATPVFASVPLLLSGHYASMVDAYVEALSGLATIGLTLANDVDHLAYSVNLWRHTLHLLGGQGIVLVVLTVFASAGGALGSLHTGEGRAEQFLPNIGHTARLILRVTAAFAAVGIPGLWVALVVTGWSLSGALFHALTLWATALHTGGFAPTTASAAIYHSPLIEALLLFLMVGGAFSWALHFQLWLARPGELRRNLEVRSLGVSVLALFTVMVVGLARFGTYDSSTELARIGLFQITSAQTTTGLATVPQAAFVSDWGVLAPAALVVAMALGGMAGSTTGGIKAVRVGVLLKSLAHDIRRALLPESAVAVQTYHLHQPRTLRNEHVRAAATILLLYLLTYLAGGILALFYGYELEPALFESTAATSSGGLSTGLVRPGLELPLKLLYALQMLLGRLEFITVLALGGYIAAIVRGRT
jgi:trk system potassium uptake protein TrkH